MSGVDELPASGVALGRIGVIGLGLMGSAVVESLARQGVTVVGFDLDAAKAAALAAFGLQPAGSPKDVAARCRCVLLSLPDASVSKAVLQAEDGLAAGGAQDLLVIDATTGDPGEMRALGEWLAARGGHYLDMGVGGSRADLLERRAIFLAGGSERAFELARPVLAALGEKLFHLGPGGCGSQAKLIFNLVLGLHRAVLAEALALGRQVGLDEGVLLAALKAGPAYSNVMESKGEKMLTRTYPPVARLAQHLKDVRLMLALGHEAGAALPLSALHAQLLQSAVNLGFGGDDNAAIFEAYLALSGERRAPVHESSLSITQNDP